MKSSQWYNNKSQQSILRDVPRVPAIVRAGPSNDGTQRGKKGTQEKEYFIVGKSQVGGGEVVGG